MRSTFFAAGLFAAAAIASPLTLATRDAEEPCDVAPCMTQAQAAVVANNFKTLISDYSNSSAMAFCSDNFQDYSDSVISLINSGCPNGMGPATFGAATFTSRDAFMAGQGSQPDIPFELLNLWHNCDTVMLRWRTTVMPGATEFVTGIIVLETTYSNTTSEPFLIDTVYSEFNSGSWLVDLGVFKPTCPAGPPVPSRR